ncbi:AAA family ATPase [Pigmentiphaga aceris]|uniref:histidine kinase n=1 Tax=Pigmentiphaga aceris TaxID=1940612 RepID=A0A5C0AT33_9BURK|nr:AAA family ATPase [Pigmentiphaga aceris]QEI04776.1 AAA family ATPase [Pigmentiphaga aceris]
MRSTPASVAQSVASVDNTSSLPVRPPLWLVELLGEENLAAAWTVLRRDGRLAVHRSTDPGSHTLLIASPDGTSASPTDINQLAHEVELAPTLDAAWAVMPLALYRRLDRAALVLRDPGGEFLEGLLDQPWPVGDFLGAARAIAQSVSAMHAAGIVHTALKPSNLLVDRPRASARVTGFGRAARIADGPLTPSPAERVGDDLPYMSPEQTGRTGRLVDVRSDLYALGIIFYRMLAGELPFAAFDPMAWVHSHLARRAVPLSESGQVPEAVSAIVMKLLAKAPEERYQTAAGLAFDLQRALMQWDAANKVDDFALGERDASPRLSIPDHLYGREAEVARLAAAFGHVADTGACYLVLVSGPSGSGKSALVGALQKKIDAARGRFAVGKVDQYRRDAPYATLSQALQSLVRGVLTQPEAELAACAAQLRLVLGANAALMINLVPELEHVIGRQAPVPELPPTEAQARFHRLLCGFLGVFAKATHPLVLFLDDLQWLDSATLHFLRQVLVDGELAHLLLIGAYRDNEIAPAHPLTATLDDIRLATQARFEELRLPPLQHADLQQLVGDALLCPPGPAGELADILQRSSEGNPFFAIRLLRELVEDQSITFDAARSAWAWDASEIAARSYDNDVLGLVGGALARLSPASQALAIDLACLGGKPSRAMLSAITAGQQAPLEETLLALVSAGLLAWSTDGVHFVHDRIQEAAHALMPAADSASTHLRLARALCARPAPPGLANQWLFDTVSQYRRAIPLVVELDECLSLAALSLQAGMNAKTAGAYETAAGFLLTGLAVLPADAWDTQYALAFPLNYQLAECEFQAGDLQGAAQRLQILSVRASGQIDRATVAWLQVTLHTAMDQSDRAIELCLDYLRQVGIAWDARPTPAQARAEYDALLQRLGQASIESLADRPQIADPFQRATLDVLTAVLPPAFFRSENLVCLVLCRMANLSMEFGNGDAAPLAYAYLGMVVGSQFGDYNAAFRFGSLGLTLVERNPSNRYAGRVFHTFGAHVIPWSRDIHTAPPFLRRAFQAATTIGDVTYGGFSSCTLITSRLGGGDALDSVQWEAETRLAFVRKAKFGLIDDIITSQLRLIRSLRGTLPGMVSFDDAEFSESAFEIHLAANPSLGIAECWYWIRKMQACLFGGDFQAALRAACKADALIWTSPGHFEWAEYHFFAALTRAACHDICAPEDRADLRAMLTSHHAQLQVWAGTCPANFGGRAALVGAEIARIEGWHREAMHGFEVAIQGAIAGQRHNDEALASEVAARFYRESGLAIVATALLRKARRAYLRWGAIGKVHQLDRQHPGLAQRDDDMDSLSTSTSADLTHLDLDTIVKASEAVASQAGLPQLIDTLMVAALEHAGAQRGLLILPQDGRLRIEAEAKTRVEGVKTRLRQAAVTAADLPESILHFVIRTQQMVLLDDAATSNDFSGDPYLSTRRCRSVLCLPLIKQAELIGLLYLENELSAGVFTPSRVAVLRLLASTAAVSVQNATLEEKESLLKEVHHRVKNNLQLISSLLSLQASSVADPAVAELFAESRNRVRSMALVHENLYRAGNFARVPMLAHLQSLCAQLVRAYGMQARSAELIVEGDNVQLDLDRAISCGLITNELVSNAMKHAFPPERRSGRVVVAMRLNDGGRLALSVADDGIGLPEHIDIANAPSLGLQLVHDLSMQLDGRLVVRREGGTSFTITFDLGDAAPNAS